MTINKSVDLVITLGGDGTMLWVKLSFLCSFLVRLRRDIQVHYRSCFCLDGYMFDLVGIRHLLN